ncbi:hypothetical protein DKX38_025138 [Salix brachista]|uniref:DUF7722 domain-containing protein n=1 Tax=Salix brachista TaxID=2182728 RepID=A0A5N5JNL3_9ROSI|nr:hypothetical protein DKX38_025138 [Salix brachista]
MERGRYVSGLALLFPERAHKENCGCHNEVQEDQNSKNKEPSASTRSLLPAVIGEESAGSSFQMPLHYPNYTEEDYEDMPESKLDLLLASYGLSTYGDLNYKRKFAMQAFIWPDSSTRGKQSF